MFIMIDNYDSFTYNLVQYFNELGKDVVVFRNDEVTIEKIQGLKPDHICISPGPGKPRGAGICIDLVRALSKKSPMLGICLGHQVIGEGFGGRVVSARKIMHGKTSFIFHDGIGLFKNLPSPFKAVRYHSLIIEKHSIPSCLEITAWTQDGEIMGIRHKHYDVEGVQFHPESILSEHGHMLLHNFISKIPLTKP